MHTRYGTAPRCFLRGILFAASVAALGLLATPSHAQFLVNPAGGTDISGNFASLGQTDPDDGSSFRSLGGTFSFYGTGFTSLYAQVNGFLSTADGYGFSSDRTVPALTTAVGGSVISAFYDDFVIKPGNSVLEKVVAGSYYSLTYDINSVTSAPTAQDDRFQTVLFTGNTVINGVSFRAGDIVFSYGALNAPVVASAVVPKDATFSVGVAQTASNGTSPFGGNSQFATTAAFTSNFNSATQALLFRPTTVGGVASYTQTLTPLAASPEPSQFAAFGLGILGVGALALRARRRRSIPLA